MGTISSLFSIFLLVGLVAGFSVTSLILFSDKGFHIDSNRGWTCEILSEGIAHGPCDMGQIPKDPFRTIAARWLQRFYFLTRQYVIRLNTRYVPEVVLPKSFEIVPTCGALDQLGSLSTNKKTRSLYFLRGYFWPLRIYHEFLNFASCSPAEFFWSFFSNFPNFSLEDYLVSHQLHL